MCFLCYIYGGEGFSTLLNDAKRTGIVRVALIARERLAINHLFFTDDCVLFGDAIEVEAQNVHYIIKEYEAALGQQVKFEKSFLFFGSNVNDREGDLVGTVLGVRTTQNPEKYLGLPMMVAKVLKAKCFPQLDKMSANIGAYPSLTWRSIWSARGLTKKGFGWHVGTGEQVNIWNDLWLPIPVIYDVKKYEECFEKITFRFARREANMAAHALAKKGCMFLEPRYWVEEAPVTVEQAAAVDWNKGVSMVLPGNR
ncbi:hypothetical protein PVK06_023312 [Gossypium arboreum]|uniref:RNase H type-1 domain-containing protein n=1 Tax=Gossypium arboreum TaxID=29729 RepID=A0ABR0PAU5_GOSAR|nr:hypothetical protein PVK06_023312 [Gossypium arboreum]